MGSNNYNVHLSFTADANAAKAQIKSLQQELNKLATGKTLPSGITELSPEIQRATLAAGELQAKLESAINVNTGKLDLGKFSSSLRASGKELSDYAQELSALGPQGQQAFMQMAQAVVAAETPIIRCSDKLKDLGVSIKNAAKWQISSSIIHGLWGGLQSAYGYAEDLNKSLNDIRIVTGQNISQMDKFAEKANKAAKQLSATTLDYTNASLIYYQQGLTDSEVAERTAVTIKMANAAGESAATVSDQLTAVWNNFYDGSKSLEYYADVMTALGAATASSTDEISEGLEKFASVAETVGLSYEYATAALATVTATTRQSADVVGTAFKTLFARLQDLELGDTLDDGTTLGQYSEALNKVGVNIKDTNGEMKKMDDILDELGAKWGTLSKSTQVALAQTVAGTRQYTQLVSLMDNWDYFKENLGVANNATGALQEQADIYAESWEAARDRVTASWEAIFDKLINDKAFIHILDGVSAIVDKVGTLIDALGGLRGVLFTIGSIATRLFQDEISKGIYNLTQTITNLTPMGQKATKARKEEAIETMKQMRPNGGGLSGDAEQTAWENEVTRQDWLAKNTSKLTQEQMAQVQLQNQLARQLEQRAIAAAKEAEAAQNETQALMDQLSLQKKIAEVRKIREKHEDDYDKINELEEKKENFSAQKDKEKDTDYQSWKQNRITFAVQSQEKKGFKNNKQLNKFQNKIQREAQNSIKGTDSEGDQNAYAEEYMRILNSYISNGSGSQQNMAKTLQQAILDGAKVGMDEYIADLDAQIKAIRAPIEAEISAAEGRIDASRAKVEEIVDKAASVSSSSTLLGQTAQKVKISGNVKDISKDAKAYDQLQRKVLAVKTALSQLDNQDAVKDNVDAAEKWSITLAKVLGLAKKIQSADFNPDTAEGKQDLADYEAAVQEVNNAIEEMRKQEKLLVGEVATKALTKGAEEMSEWDEGITDYTEQKHRQKVKEGEADNTKRDVDEQPAPGQQPLSGSNDKMMEYAQTITSVTQAITSLGAVVTTVQGVIDVFNTPDASAWDKIIAIFSGGVSIISSVSGVLMGLNSVAELTGMSFATMWTSFLGPASLVIAVLAAVTAAIVFAADAAYKASPEGQLEAAQKKAEELETALDETTAAAEKLKNTFDNYNSAVDKLEECTKGTTEWRDALREVNNEVMDMLSEYPELATMVNKETGEKAISYGKNGELVVADWAQEDMLDKANQATANIKTASILANQDVREKKAAVEQSDLTEAIDKKAGYGAATKTYYAGGQSYTADMSRQVASYISSHAEEFSNATPEDQETMLGEYFSSQGIIADVDTWMSVLNEYGSSLGELAQTIDANTAAVQLENEALAANTLANNDAVQNSDYADEITQIVAKDLDKKTDDEVQKLIDDGWGTDGISKATGVNEKARKVFADYAKAAGITNYDLTDTTGTDKNRAFVYTNSEGNEVTVSLDMMRSVVAAANANEKLAGNASQLVTTLADKDEQEVAAITAAVTGKANKLTVDQATGDYDIETQANSLTEQDFLGMGYEGTLEEMRQAYIADYNKVAENANTQLTSIIDSYTDSVSSQMSALRDSGALTGMTLEDVDALGGALQQAFINSGTEGMQTLSDLYSQAAEAGFGDEFVDALSGIDWDTATPTTLIEALEECGVETDYSEESLRALIAAMKDYDSEIQNANNKYKTLHDIIDGLETGDTITDEQYKALGPDMEDYFLKMADGSYMLIADAEEFYNLVNESSLEGFKAKIGEASVQNEQINSILNEKGSLLDDNGLGSESHYTYVPSSNGYTFNKETDSDFANQQIAFLESTGYGDQTQLAQWKQDVVDGTLSVNELTDAVNSHVDTLGGWSAAEEQLKMQQEANNATIAEGREELASTAQTTEELVDLMNQGLIDGDSFDKALIGVAAKEGLDPELIEDYADSLQRMYGEYVDNEAEARRLAVAQAKVDRGVKTLSDSFEDYTEMLSSGDTSSMDYISTLAKVESAFKDITGVDVSNLSDVFLQSADTLTLMQQAAEGDADAIVALQQLAAQDILLHLDTDSLTEEASTAYSTISDWLASNPDLEVGMSLDDAGMYQAFQDLLDSGAMTVDQMNDLLSGIGYDPVIEYEEVDSKSFDRSKQTGYIIGSNGQYVKIDANTDLEAGQKIYIPKINSKKTSVKAPPAPKASSSQSSSGRGSSSKPEKMDYTKKSDVVERYKEVNDQLDNVADSMSKVQNIADTLWGKDHAKNLKEQNKLLDEQIALLDEEYEEALAYKEQDAKAVKEAAEALGLSAVVDMDEGRITNIESIQEQYYNQLHAAEEYYNSLTTKDAQDSYKETVLEPLEKRWEAFTDAVGLFEDSADTATDAALKKQEAQLQQMANNFEIWSEGFEIPIELNSKDIEYIEWLISRLEDDVYEMAEKGALMVGNLFDGKIGGTMAKYIDNIDLAETSLADFEAQYAAGKITQADYISGLDTISDSIMENIQNMDELDKQMQELYGETIEAAMDELSKYTEQLEHSTSVLEHYKNVIELMGKSNDYEMIGKVLEGQTKTAKNQMEVSKQWYQTMRTNADTAAAEYAAAQARGASEAELEILKKNWDEAETAANEAQEQMLSDAESWAEAMKEALENKLAGLGQTLENALTGGTSFDTITSQLEHASSLQEEYLTTTNQIYETNKLMRQAQQEIDKTTNSVAKKKLAAYINETQQLQNQSKLSNYELEIQQAKYNLLLAEIALQEAQDAKSVVRLQRDSEGNLGYVYTADQDKIADAQQQLEDAQNSLYNIGLEGANNYTEKYQQLMSEMYDTLTDLQSQYLDGAFESEEEYQKKVEETKQYYYEKLKQYSSLYQIALTTDSRVIADAWSTDFADMTYQTDQWMQAVDTYVDAAAKAFIDWHDEVTGPDGLGGIGLEVDNVASSVQTVVDKSNELADTTINTVIPALDSEIDSVQNLTGSYATLRDTIIEIIDKYGLMIDTINGKKRSYWDGDSSSDSSSSSSSDGTSESGATDTSSSDGTTGAQGNAAATSGLKVGDRVTVKGSARQFSQKSGNQYMQEWVPGTEFEVFRIDGSQVLIGDRKRAGTYTGWVNRSDLEGFDIGGYTGEWGSYGKLAMLHQKELVLNANDTENLLESMELLNRILEVIDLQSASARLGGLLSSPGVKDNNSVIEQNVHIEASFPNVESHSEIEEAFNNLINQASQYANRK